jgi:hypothetical protein
MRISLVDPTQPSAPPLRVEVAEETVGQLADRAAEHFGRGADAGVVTIQQGQRRHIRIMAAELLDQDEACRLVV